MSVFFYLQIEHQRHYEGKKQQQLTSKIIQSSKDANFLLFSWSKALKLSDLAKDASFQSLNIQVVINTQVYWKIKVGKSEKESILVGNNKEKKKTLRFGCLSVIHQHKHKTTNKW